MRIDLLKKEANNILEKRIAECSSIEYKASASQLDKILKTICAFGNNYYENAYSFIFVGVEEINDENEKATPKLPLKGIEEGKIEKEKNLLNSLKPFIYPNVKYEVITNEFKNKKYLLVVVLKQNGGPFSVTEQALKDKRIGLKPGRYIRIESSSRIANVSEEYSLLRKFAQYHFSSSLNDSATISDLDIDYLRDYLSLTSSRDINNTMSKEEIVRSLNLCEINEVLSKGVKNFALLMFNKNPSKFIPYSNIEVIANVLGNEDKMEAKTFSGPIYKQYYNVLNYISNNFLRTLTIRENNVATNRKVSNFPFKAIEELLANAIVHKNYENEKSIQIYISEKQINIINYNKPLPPITLKDLNELFYFHERDTINPEIRDMFKSLGIIESYGTGVGEAKKACGDDPKNLVYYKEFNEDVDITSVVIPINQEYYHLSGLYLKDNNINDKTYDNNLKIEEIINNSKYNKNIKNNLNKILLDNLTNSFGARDIIICLSCSPNSATKYLKILIELNLIEPIYAIGKKKYKFKDIK